MLAVLAGPALYPECCQSYHDGDAVHLQNLVLSQTEIHRSTSIRCGSSLHRRLPVYTLEFTAATPSPCAALQNNPLPTGHTGPIQTPWSLAGTAARYTTSAPAKGSSTALIMKFLLACAGICGAAEASGQTPITYYNTNPHPSPQVAQVLCEGMDIQSTHIMDRGGWGGGVEENMMRSPQGGLSAGKGRLVVGMCPRQGSDPASRHPNSRC